MTIHVLDLDAGRTFCGGGVIGDKAITLEQARNTDNAMFFDCEACYLILNPPQESENG